MKLLDHYSILLLDMNDTFMFDGNRFGDTEDFHATYQALGGEALSKAAVNRLIRACYHGMMQDYRNPDCYNNFPSVREGLERYAKAPEAELSLLEQVFALHELGTVSGDYAAYLRQLSQTHRLALVSNLWAAKPYWIAEFKQSNIFDAFEHLVFSSDCRSIKPSAVLYQQALAGLAATAAEALFIGDSLRCDIEGANACGIATVWISSATETPACVDYVIPDLLQLDQLAL